MNDAIMRIRVVVDQRNAAAEFQQLERRLQMMEKSLARAGNSRIGGTSFLDAMVKKMHGAFQTMERFGQRIQSSGRQLTNSLTIPLVLAGAAATKFALDNERAFTQLKKVYGSVDDDVKTLESDLQLLRRAFEALSNIYGVQQDEVIRIGALWAAAGDKGTSLAKSVRLTLDTMILGEMSYEQAGRALIVLRQQYGLTSDELKRQLGILNVIENETAVSYSELIEALVRGGGAAVSAGVDIRHFGAMVSSLVPAAASASTAGNSLKTIFSRLFAPSKQAKEMLEKLGGIMGKNLLDPSKNATQRLEEMATGFVGLTQAQQAMFASTVGTRFQFSTFSTLLRDIANPLGNYKKSLKSTSDETKNLRTYTRELDTVLKSQPQALKILMTRIQNSMARAILPLLPVIFDFLRAINQLTTAFANLDPRTQRFIMFALASVAVIGPLMRVFGGLIYLSGALGKALLFPITSLMKLNAWMMTTFGVKGASGMVRSFGTALMSGMSFVFAAVGSLVETAAIALMVLWYDVIVPAMATVGAAAGTAFSTAWSAVSSVMTTIGTAAGVAFITAFEAAQAALIPVAIAAMVLWQDIIVPAMTTVGTAAGVAFITAFEAIKKFFAAIAVASLILWEGVIVPAMAPIGAAAAAAFEAGFAVLGIALPAIGAAAMAAFDAAVATAAVAGPGLIFGALIVGALAMLVIFRQRVSEIFNSIMNWLVDSTHDGIQNIIEFFGRLPGFVGDALLGVLHVVMDIGRAIYDALRAFLNPFARHSPSLVDLVVAGVDVISEKYKSLGGIGTAFRAGVADLRAFKTEMASVVAIERQQKRGEGLKSISKLAPGAAKPLAASFVIQDKLYGDLDRVTAAYGRQDLVVQKWSNRLEASQKVIDRLRTKLTSLQSTADWFSNRLNLAQADFDKWQNMPLTGMKKMGDAIFNNDIKTKKLQLQLLKLQDATGTLDELRGQLELLRGERESLRLKGAGSDVLGPLDAQIAKLTGTGSGIAGTVDMMAKLQDQIDKLTIKGQELTLQQSIQFDPLTRQIEQAAKSMKEMPFDVVIDHVKRQRKHVDALALGYKLANDKVQHQELVIKRAQIAHDKIQVSYDNEKKKLDALGETYDTIKSMIEAIDQTFQGATASAKDLTGAMFDAAGAGNFPSVKPGDLTQGFQEGLDQWLKDLEKEVNKEFGELNFKEVMLAPFKEAWRGVKNWWKTNVVGWWHTNVSWDAFNMPGGKWNIGEKIQNAWSTDVVSWWETTGKPWWKTNLSWDAFSPTGKWDITGWVSSGWNLFTGWWSATVVPFLGSMWDDFWEGLTSLPGDIGRALLGVGKIIIAPFKWAYDKLVGHSIIPDLVNEVVAWFKRLPAKIVGAIGNLGRMLVGWAAGAAFQLLGNIGGQFGPVFNWFAGLPGRIWNAISQGPVKLGEKLSQMFFNIGSGLWSRMTGYFAGLFSFFSSLGSTIASKVVGAGKWLYNAGWDAFKGFFEGAKDFIKNVPSIVKKIPVVGDIVTSVGNWKLPGLAKGGVAQARTGGIQATIAEAGRPELVAPLPPGFSMTRLVGTLDRLERYVDKQGETIVMGASSSSRELHFHGDLSFPNVHDGGDAEEFIRNLEALV